MDPEAELLKSLTNEELDAAVEEKIESFHGFLTREAALRLIAKERGLLKTEEKEWKLASIPKGERKVSFSAKVRRIWPVATYSSGKRSRVVEVEDDTGRMPLILWNDDVELARGLRTGDSVSVKGAYEKGGELHLGYSGSLSVVEKAAFTDLGELKDNDFAHMRGFVGRIEGRDRFVRGADTEPGFSFILSDGKSERRCVIFRGLQRGAALKEGDEVIIENALMRQGVVEIGETSRMLARRKQDMIAGEITKLEADGEALVAEIGGRELVFERANALRLLGAEAAEDIALSTVATLKKGSLLNSRIALRLKDGQLARC